MPTYVYKRQDGTVFEITQRISEDALKICPETGQPVKRVITGGGGVVYKGDGWYVTDYKNKSNGASESTSSGKHHKTPDRSEKDQTASENGSSTGNNGDSVKNQENTTRSS